MEKQEVQKIYHKDQNNLNMLIRSLESREIDEELIPILRKFFSLPITPIESCYGHPQQSKAPYLSYVEDETKNEQEIKLQKSLRSKISELESSINQRIGEQIINILLTETDHGNGPKDYTFKFQFNNENISSANSQQIMTIIWDEFSKYLDQL